MKGIITTIALSVGMFVGMAFTPAHANPITIQKMPAKMTMVAGDPKTLLTGNENDGLATYLLNGGVTKANVYQVSYKNNNNFYYAIAGDTQIGTTTLLRLGLIHEDADATIDTPPIVFDMTTHRIIRSQEATNKSRAAITAAAIKKAQSSVTGVEEGQVSPERFSQYLTEQARANPVTYRVTTPFVYNQKTKSYDGVIDFYTIKDQYSYANRVYLQVYNDKYYGLSVRFVTFAKTDDSAVGQIMMSTFSVSK